MTGQMASEGTSRGRQRPSHHLKACLRGFQMVYRAHILCEELKLKIVATSKNFEAVRPLFQSEAAWGHSSDLKPPRPPYMILKWLALTSGCQIWPRPRMASAASSDLGSSKQRPRLNLTSKSHLGRILSCFNMIFLRKTKNPIFTQSFSHCVKGGSW